MKCCRLLLWLGLALLALLPRPAAAQESPIQEPPVPDGRAAWRDLASDAASLPAASPLLDPPADPLPARYRLLALDRGTLAAVLAAAPAETNAANPGAAAPGAEPLLLALPLPEGGFGRFAVTSSPVLTPPLAARYPAIQTYRGVGVDDPSASARLGLTPNGFHALILNGAGGIYITPYSRGPDPLYMSYFAADAAPEPFTCGLQDDLEPVPAGAAQRAGGEAAAPALATGAELRTYRLAMAASGEFAQHAAELAGITNPTPDQLRAAALDALVARANLVNAIYEREVAIHFTLVAGNEQLIFVDPATDPYSAGDLIRMMDQNQGAVDAAIGFDNYDVGHVLGGRSGAGIAYLAVTCGWRKASAVSAVGAALGPGPVRVTAHELGHQFGAGHTFHGSGANCTGNRTAWSAYEPGSGSTIMAYPGACGGGQNLPSLPTLFHVASFGQIVTYSGSAAGACGVPAPANNAPPTVDAGPDRTIPARTPFVLSGSASDPDGGALVFGWQQMDLGAAPVDGTATLTEAMTDWGSGPLFRVYPLAAEGAVRSFPGLSHVLSGTQALGEVYPTTTRTLNFHLLAQDNAAATGEAGGAATDAVQINVVDTGAAFAVTRPDGAGAWEGGTVQTVAWNVAGTNAAPIACTAVDILLSTDDGASFPTTLAAGTPNDGAEPVPLPAVSAAAARVQVRCSSNIFYNVSTAFALTVPAVLGGLAGMVQDAGGAPVAGASVTASAAETVTVVTGGDGRYALALLPGAYTLTVTAFGYRPATAEGLAISAGVTTTRDITLTALPPAVVTGTVTDAGHGYGLQARLILTGANGLEAARAWSDPVSGVYSVTLRAGAAYSASVEATLPGYGLVLAPFDAQTPNVTLAPAAGCAAPGYELRGGECRVVAGGLLAGSVYGPNGEALAGVNVSGGGRSTTSAATADPRLLGAFYTLFLPPGSQPITATGSSGGAALPALRATVTITANAVTAYDLTWQALYRDASLRSLQLSAGLLTPPFASGITTYTASVPFGVESVTLLPVASVAGAGVRVDGQETVSGVSSTAIRLSVGTTVIPVEVTALDSSSQAVYTVTVTRAAAGTPLYLPDVRR